MDALTALHATDLPAPELPDRNDAAVESWLHRSEGFAEDLPGEPAVAWVPRTGWRSTPALAWGLGVPLAAAVIGLSAWLGLA